MGCSSSVPDPNLMYGSKADPDYKKQIANGNNKIFPQKNGSVRNGHVYLDEKHAHVADGEGDTEIKSRELKGDLMTYNIARLSRQKSMIRQLEKREKLAQEMSAKVMDDKERLSLSTTRSRTTSRTSSPRAPQTRTQHGHVVLSSSPPVNTQPAETMPYVSRANNQRNSGLTKIEEPDNSHKYVNGSFIAVASQKTDDESRDKRELTNHQTEHGLPSQRKEEESELSNVGNVNSTVATLDADSSRNEHLISHDALLENETTNKKDKPKRHKNKSKKASKSKESNSSIRNDIVSHG